MADFKTKSKAELEKLLGDAGVEVPEGTKKPGLVALAEEHLVKGSDEESDEASSDEKSEDEESDDVDLEDVTMASAGFKPTGRYEVVKVGEDKELVEEDKRVFRVFGPQGQKVTPLLKGKAKATDHPLAPELSSEGRASKVAADHNIHVQKAVGRDAYAKIVKNAIAQGFER